MKIVHNKPATPSVIITGMKARQIKPQMTNIIAMVVTAPIMPKMIQEINVGRPVATSKNSTQAWMRVVISGSVSIPNYIGVPYFLILSLSTLTPNFFAIS